MGLFVRVGCSAIAGLLASCIQLDSSGVGSGFAEVATSTTATSTSSHGPTEDPGGSTSIGASGSTTRQDSTGPEADGTDSSSGESGELEPWPTGPFGGITRVDVLNTNANDDDPSLTADMLEIVFESNRSGNQDLYASSRSRVDDEWDPPQPITELNEVSTENTPELSADGLILMFSSTRRNRPDADVFISYRSSRNDPWEPPLEVTELNTSDEENAPTLIPTLQQIYLCSGRPSGLMGQNIWRADVTMDGAVLSFGPPEIVMDVSTDDNDCSTAVSPDGLVIVFDIADDQNTAIWEATRDSAGGVFGNAARHDELDVDGQSDQDPWVSPDGHVIYFSSTRPDNGEDNGQDIYLAER
ncbi:MAG: hypothetical protein AAGF11_25040 [Myxococcota bacterium]